MLKQATLNRTGAEHVWLDSPHLFQNHCANFLIQLLAGWRSVETKSAFGNMPLGFSVRCLLSPLFAGFDIKGSG